MTTTPPSSRSSTLMEGLPRQFVASMRTLFDIMDDRKLGYVHLADIEARWPEETASVRNDNNNNADSQEQQQQAGTTTADAGKPQQLPRGVIESLRKVTTPNGLLTFERFCAGLKICLLRATPPVTEGHHQHQHHHHHGRRSVPSQSVPPIVARTHSTDVIRVDQSSHQQSRGRPEVVAAVVAPPLSINSNGNSGNTATVRPNIVLPSTTKTPLRTVSMPQLMASSNQLSVASQQQQQQQPAMTLGDESLQHPLEQRMPAGGGHAGRNHEDATSAAYRSRNRRGIMTMLHNWHVGMLNDQQLQVGGGGSDDGAGVDNTGVEHGREYTSGTRPPSWTNRGGPTAMNRRREPRRHTLANGIDYNMLKRMKQMEQEKDVLMQGLEAVDKARAWYLRQIVQLQEKMKYIEHGSSHQEYSTEAHQERLNFEMAQIFEVNQNLSALVESSERGFPLHMNLAVRQRRPLAAAPSSSRSRSMDAAVAVVSDYEQQRSVDELNRQLSMKSERITQLEMEKAALVRELFQARSQVKSSSGGRESHDISLM